MSDLDSPAGFDDLDVGIIVLDGAQAVRGWNRWMAEQSGLSAADVLGKPLFALFPDLADSRLARAVEETLAFGTSSVVSHYLNPNLLPLGNRVGDQTQPTHQSIITKPLQGRTGCLLQVHDITVSVRRERQLRQGRAARYRAIVDTATDAIVTVDESGIIHSANRAAHALFGSVDGALVDTPVAVRLEQFEEGRTRVHRADGREVHVDISIGAWTAEGRRFFTAIMRDVTARIEMERTIIAAKEEAVAARIAAETANRAKSKFLAAATHDLRQPVQSLMLFSAALATGQEYGRTHEVLSHMDKALGALKGLLDSLLDISKLDAGIVHAKREAFPISDLMDAIDSGYAGVAAAKGLGWSVSAPDVAVHSDPNLLGRMVRNLVENAIRYTRHGVIGVECAVRGARLAISVRDTGIGIPPESLEEIFTEFHQLANPERDQKQGLGLGLAIVRRLAGLLDHPVDVRSVPGQGSVFTVEVPLDRVEAVGPDAPERLDGSGVFAILIDDNPVILMGLRALMEQWDYTLQTAESCDEAVAELSGAARAPDVIVADYRLREERTGTQAIHTIRARFGTHIPAVMLTGENSPECVHDSQTEGFTILHKPVEPEQLRRTLAEAIRAAGLRRPRSRHGVKQA
ncbi:PAS domain S-box protein [Azospirillum sp. TSO22-1]|uniref:PAS domain-containing hybrid sensor histidine kinase/response regulator n=1 Tax=Azospirillum sp. TSO22-1 TaxID=716789 RepID=UPI000D658F7B|nr:PAS domain S-box protein [Azospirillum sp. TSO22-1]